MLARREAWLVWVHVVFVGCGGRSVRFERDEGISRVDGGKGGAMPFGAAGTIAVGGTAPFVEMAGASGSGGMARTAGMGGTSGAAGNDRNDEAPEPKSPCDDGPHDPTSGIPCEEEPPPVNCDALALEYQVQVGIAQWCERDADCHAGIPVPFALHCGCDVIVRSVHTIAPIAAEWRAGGCHDETPCRSSCAAALMPYKCGEAGFCLDDNR
jgi:hypothetical protein